MPQSIPTQSIKKTVKHKNMGWRNNRDALILRGKCYRCEKPSRRADSCKFITAVFNKSGTTTGHMATVCKKQQQYQRNVHQQHQLYDRSDDEGKQQEPNAEFMINCVPCFFEDIVVPRRTID
jgi:hypothetical protein